MPTLDYSLPDLPRVLDAEAERYELLTLSRCPTCLGAGEFRWNRGADYLVLGDDVEPPIWICDCRIQKKLRDLLVVRGIPEAHHKQGWDDLTEPMGKAYTEVLAYAGSWRNYVDAGLGLLLHGPHGSGKSTLACLLVKAVLNDSEDARYVTLQNLVTATVASWGTAKSYDLAQANWLRHKLLGAPLLVIDNVGMEDKAGTELQQRVLSEAVNTRVDSGKATVVATKMTPEELDIAYLPQGGRSLMSTMEPIPFRDQNLFLVDSVRKRELIDRGIRRPIRLG